MRLSVLTFALFMLAAAQTAAARDLFVNNVSGDDHNDALAATFSGNRRGPAQTITKALRVAEAGDRVFLAKTERPYRECVTLQGGRHSGFGSYPFVLDGQGATLDGTRPVPVDAWTHAGGGVFRFQPTRMHHQQLFIEDKLPDRIASDRSTDQLPQLAALQWTIHRGAIHFRPEQEKSLRSYNLRYAAEQVGLTLYEVRHVVVRNLTVQGYQLDGINAHDSAMNVALVEVVSRANGRSGISIGGASRVEITGGGCGSNGVVQLRTEGHSHAKLTHVNLATDTAPAWTTDGGKLTIDGKPATGAAAK